MDDATVPGLDSEIREAIYDHVFANDDHEVGGVLVGRLGHGRLPEVTGMIAALEADGQRASVTFTHDAWAMIHATMDEEFAGEQIVGWYHSHPGFGIFLSNYDRFIHDNFFSDPRQIAYVVDPHAGSEGVFHWDEGGVLQLLWEGPSDRPGTGNRSRVIEREDCGHEGRDPGQTVAPSLRVTAVAQQERRAPNVAFELPVARDGRSGATEAQRRAAAGIVGALLVILIAALILTSGTTVSRQPAKAGTQHSASKTSTHRRSHILRAGTARTVRAVVTINP